jgi:hypothetical protein
MARRPKVFAAGLLYHVIVRGNQQRKTFRSDDDHKAYVDRLEHCQRKYAGWGHTNTNMRDGVRSLHLTIACPFPKFGGQSVSEILCVKRVD